LVWPLKFRANSKPGSVSFSSGLLHLKSIFFLSYFFDIFALCVTITRPMATTAMNSEFI
jgi:hypothetical protein